MNSSDNTVKRNLINSKNISDVLTVQLQVSGEKEAQEAKHTKKIQINIIISILQWKLKEQKHIIMQIPQSKCGMKWFSCTSHMFNHLHERSK